MEPKTQSEPISTWPTFSNTRYPLKPDEGSAVVSESTVLQLISDRLERLIHRYMDDHNLSMGAFAKQVGVGKNAPRRWINDPSTMPSKELETFCRLASTTPEYIRGETSIKNDIDHDSYADYLRDMYLTSLDHDQRSLVVNMVRQLVKGNLAKRRVEELQGNS